MREEFFMEIVKKKIRMSRQRSQAMNQITLEEDLNVPDSKADVTGIIQHRAKVRVEESKIMENPLSGKLVLLHRSKKEP